MTELSISIVSYNSAAYLPGCLDSLLGERGQVDLEIFVVDNGSRDDSIRVVREQYPQVHLIESDRNLGYGAANNRALGQASGEFLLVLNPDTVIPPGALRTLLAMMATRANVGMIGPKLRRADGTLDLSCRRRFPNRLDFYSHLLGLDQLFPRSRVLARYALTFLDPDAPGEVDCLSGAFILLRREVFEQIGGFDEDFFMFGEDLDWTYRTKLAGWIVYYYPAVEVLHYQGVSTRKEPDRTVEFHRATLQLYDKYYAPTTSPVLNALIKYVIRLKLLEFLVRWRSRPLRRSLQRTCERLAPGLIPRCKMIIGGTIRRQFSNRVRA